MKPRTLGVFALSGIVVATVITASRSADASLAPHSHSVPASAFVPANDSAKYSRDTTSLINRGARMVYVAPVYLPGNARILSIELDGFDRVPHVGMFLQLVEVRRHGDSSWLLQIDTAQSWREAPQTWYSNAIEYPVQAHFAYTLVLIMPELSGPDPTSIRFSGARVIYGLEGRDTGR